MSTGRISSPAGIVAGLIFALLAVAVQALAPVNGPAYAALQHGRVDDATSLLRAALAANPNNPEAHQLLCRAAYAQDHADDAIAECRLATEQAPASSDHQMWLGRALGLKASHTNPISAIGIARQVRTAFERAVQLDPGNVYAASDLGEFYIGAPSFLGGSPEKTRALASSLQSRSPARAHRLLALLAEKSDDKSTAEQEFKLAIAAGKTPEAYADLAIFYKHTDQLDKVEPSVAAALAADSRHGPVQVDAASILVEAHGNHAIAIQALRAYLHSDAQTDEAPVFKVHVQLGNLLAKNKDKEGARREYSAALAMAANYAPARKALQGL